jgi:hypothetical protein
VGLGVTRKETMGEEETASREDVDAKLESNGDDALIELTNEVVEANMETKRVKALDISFAAVNPLPSSAKPKLMSRVILGGIAFVTSER